MSDRRPVATLLDPPDAYRIWASAYPSHAHNPFMLAEERAVLSLLPSSLRGQRVLDIGCGTGRYLNHALRRQAAALAGVDQSPEMLRRGQLELARFETQTLLTGGAHDEQKRATLQWLCARMERLPIQSDWSDISICALAIGHSPLLAPVLAELRRVTKPGGTILCSDFHPVGRALGWERSFRVEGHKYAVRHTTHSIADWRQACSLLKLRIVSILEPQLDPADVPEGAQFDRAALTTPVAVVYQLATP